MTKPARAREIGFADDVSTDPLVAVQDADIVILCVPVGIVGQVGADRLAIQRVP